MQLGLGQAVDEGLDCGHSFSVVRERLLDAGFELLDEIVDRRWPGSIRLPVEGFDPDELTPPDLTYAGVNVQRRKLSIVGAKVDACVRSLDKNERQVSSFRRRGFVECSDKVAERFVSGEIRRPRLDGHRPRLFEISFKGG